MGWEVGGRLKREETCVYNYGWSMLMYGRNQRNIVIILQLQIKIFLKIRQLSKATLISLLKGSWGVWGHCQRLSISVCSWSQQKWKILFYGLPWRSKGSVQFSRSVVWLSANPMDRSTPGLPVHHQLLEFTQTQVQGLGLGVFIAGGCWDSTGLIPGWGNKGPACQTAWPKIHKYNKTK